MDARYKLIRQVELNEITDDFVLPLPDQVMDDMGWSIDTPLLVEVRDNSIFIERCVTR